MRKKSSSGWCFVREILCVKNWALHIIAECQRIPFRNIARATAAFRVIFVVLIRTVFPSIRGFSLLTSKTSGVYRLLGSGVVRFADVIL